MARDHRLSPRGLCLAAAALMLAAGGCRRAVEQVQWPVMGTVAAVKLRGHDPAQLNAKAAAARETFAEVERLMNEHDPGSELSRLARLPESALVAGDGVTPRALPCYRAAFALMHASGGAFNPRWRGADTLDFGAVAKGFAVDQAAENPLFAKGADCLIDLGGNIKAARGRWKAGVMNPLGPGFAATVELEEGESLATSATYYRGRHIYDGRTGQAVSNGVASVTVFSESALWADALSTTLFVLGPGEGRAFLEKARDSLLVKKSIALWILDDGRIETADADRRFSLLAPRCRVGDKRGDRR